MLGDFFRINMPYGIRRTDSGEWYAFNREYMPLGFNDMAYKAKFSGMDLPIYTRYKNLTESVLLSVAWHELEGVIRDGDGKINVIFLYNDATNPTNNNNPDGWAGYFDRIKQLSLLVENTG